MNDPTALTGAAESGFPEDLPLVGTADIGVMFGVTSRLGAWKITQRPGFPAPVARLGGKTGVWWGPAVEAYREAEDEARLVLGRGGDRRFGRQIS